MSSIVSRTLPAAPGSYATAAQVRVLAGLSSTNDISDADLNELILDATLRLVRDITLRVQGAELEVKDTARKVFQLPTGLVADQNCDASVTADDVVVRFWKQDTDGQILTSATGAVTVQDSLLGIVSTVNALPVDYTATIDYAHYIRPLELNDAKRAVKFLAAHFAYLRVKAPGRITRADLTAIGAADGEGRDGNMFKQRTKWGDVYRRQVATITGRPVV